MSVLRNVVRSDFTVHLITPDAAALALLATFRYLRCDPYAVEVTFSGERVDDSVTWGFARDLLVEGLDCHAGQGDVRVWPWFTPRGNFLAMVLSSPEDGDALFELPRGLVERFLNRTYALVPLGGESVFVDVDEAVGEMLRPRWGGAR